MKNINAHIVHAFVDGVGGGNPAGVVLEADQLSKEEKQKIAAQVGLSETAFVSSSTKAEFKLEFFTPTQKIPDCGHATVAAFSLLKQEGFIQKKESSKEIEDGVRKIFLDDDMVFMEQKSPEYISLANKGISVDQIGDSLNIDSPTTAFISDPMIVSTGGPFLLVGVTTRKLLQQMQPDLEAIRRISKNIDVHGYYLFTLDSANKERTAVTRMFAPLLGIREESATGMAAGALASFLYQKMGIQKSEILIEQGTLMSPPSPSLLHARLEIKDGEINSLLIGGRGKVIRTMNIGG